MPGTAPATSVTMPMEGRIPPSGSCPRHGVLCLQVKQQVVGGQLQVARAAAGPRWPLQELGPGTEPEPPRCSNHQVSLLGLETVNAFVNSLSAQCKSYITTVILASGDMLMKADQSSGTTKVHLGTLGYCVLPKPENPVGSVIGPQKIGTFSVFFSAISTVR